MAGEAIDQTLVSYARDMLYSGKVVSILRTGSDKLIGVRDIHVADTGLIVMDLAEDGAPVMIVAPGQLSAVRAT